MILQRSPSAGALSLRVRLPELMDSPELESGRHYKALDGLRRINFWSRTSAYFARALHKWTTPGSSLRVLDLASGGGDVVLGLENQLRRRGLNLQIDGCDVSQRAIDYAQHRAVRQGSDARFFKLDVLQSPLPSDYDVLISSLFFHHLTEPEIASLLRRMTQASRIGILVSDLERRPTGYWLARLAPRFLTTSAVVHTDSVRSVHAALTRGEMESLLRQAGLEGYRLDRHWPCRLFLSWRRSL